MERPAFEKAPEDIDAQLLSGKVSPEAFLQELLARDQAFSNRHAAIANTEILTRPEISEFFEAHTEELSGYENLLSLSYFHRGQIEAIEERDNGAAATSFNQALAWARRAEAHDASYRSWRAYVEGTAAYFNSDLETLKRVYDADEIDPEDDRNKEILGNLASNLETGRRIDYRSAYGL